MAEDTESSVTEKALKDTIIRSFLGNDIADAAAAIDKVAGFELSAAESQPFSNFVCWLNTRPRFIAEWRSDKISEMKFYHRFVGGIDACRDGYSACVYHLGHMRDIEEKLYTILDQFDFSKSVPRNSSVGFGNTKRWDFEYQAFVVAYRQSLDRLVWGLSTYFKQQQSSFHKFEKDLPRYSPRPVADALLEVYHRHIRSFDFVIGKERGLSIRDRIAHRESVQAGSINVGNYGHRVVGGGEDLGLRGFADHRRLTAALQDRLSALHNCIRELLSTFQIAAIDYETGEHTIKTDSP